MHQDANWYGGRPWPLCSMWTQLRPEKMAHSPHPIFGPCLLWPNGWMDENADWYESRPRPRPHCTRRGPSSREMGTAVPLFSAHVYCGHGRPSQLLLSSCCRAYDRDRQIDRQTTLLNNWPHLFTAMWPKKLLVDFREICEIGRLWTRVD